jgi:hypothetical protein
MCCKGVVVVTGMSCTYWCEHMHSCATAMYVWTGGSMRSTCMLLHVCVLVRKYTNAYACCCIPTHTRTSFCQSICTVALMSCTCLYASTYLSQHVNLCMYVCMHECKFVCVSEYTNKRTFALVCIIIVYARVCTAVPSFEHAYVQVHARMHPWPRILYFPHVLCACVFTAAYSPLLHSQTKWAISDSTTLQTKWAITINNIVEAYVHGCPYHIGARKKINIVRKQDLYNPCRLRVPTALCVTTE